MVNQASSLDVWSWILPGWKYCTREFSKRVATALDMESKTSLTYFKLPLFVGFSNGKLHKRSITNNS